MEWLWWIVPFLICGWMIWSMARMPMGSGPKSSALERLRERYAAGELTTEEFEERKAVLERDQARGEQHAES